MLSLWENLARPLLFGLDAEGAHEIGIKGLEMGLASPFYVGDPSFGSEPIERFGLKFANPLGVAAGFDKNGLVVDQLSSLGFGSVEVGTVTFSPQGGNEKPRLFRLPDDQALINRLGFNNRGADAVAERLGKVRRKCIVGINIGRNKDVPNDEAIENYLACFEIVHSVADYIAVNVSSPNTPNLRDLQHEDNLDKLLAALQKRNEILSGHSRAATRRPKPILVKIAPDLNESEIEALVDVVRRNNIDGVIATNTTISRNGLKTADVTGFGAGGLSGLPLRSRSNEVIAKIFRYSNGEIPIIGVGGIFSAEEAFDKIASGASLVQAYTGFVYGGPTFARDVNSRLVRILKERGFETLDNAVGTGVN